MTRQIAGSSAIVWMVVLARCSASAVEASDQTWQFRTFANPAVPTVASNAAGVATATIVTGFNSAGWLYRLDGFGSQVGLWDLGHQKLNEPETDTRGRVLLSVPTPAPVGSNTYTDVALRILQYVDGFFTGELALSPPGMLFTGRVVVEDVPPGGMWVEDDFHGRLSPSPSVVSLTITGARFPNTLVSEIRVDTVGPVSLPDRLAITSVQRIGQVLVITWSGGRPPYQVYAATNLFGEASWQAVGPATSGTSTEIPLLDPVGFIKVRGSD